MSINSPRLTSYRPLNQPKPFQPRFGGTPPEGDGEVRTEGTPSPLKDDKEVLKENLEELLNYLGPHIQLLRIALGMIKDGESTAIQTPGSVQVPASVQAPASVKEADVVDAVPGEAAGTDHQEAQAPLKSKYTPRSERTRLNVGWDITKEYMGSNQVWLDMGICVAVGAVCAIGSPVMAVTIPTTMMVAGGIRLMLLAIKMFKDPQGDNIDNMYKKWMEAEAEQAKKKAEPSS